jgi:hypothetical protein
MAKHMPPSPLLITVLALTVFLVLGALVLGGVWFAQGRGGGARYQRAAKNDFVEGASVPLAHGGQRRYYDEPTRT